MSDQKLTPRPRFNWRFWRPVECIGGRVRFGPYYEIRTTYGETIRETPYQVEIKRELGIFD